MAYSNSKPFYDKLLSLFLHGEEKAPANLINVDIIRPNGVGRTTTLDVADYMAGPGRFAIPSLFEVVRKFFSETEGNLGIARGQTVSLDDLLSQLNLSTEDRRVSFNQGIFDDGNYGATITVPVSITVPVY